MKETTLTLIFLATLLFSCEDNVYEGERQLGAQLSGEWDIVQVAFPTKDSTEAVTGKASFGSCHADCRGSFSIEDSVVNFNYSLTHFPESEFPSKINIGPDEGGGSGENALRMFVGGYDILALDEHNLTMNAAYCEYDADDNCITTPRHFIMTR